ncbi:MAG: bifunctional 5,10-methylenetetrahydrofolate dehydrogenase/5,10-methenyltetrahydrofolate cyclohydrolase [Candidatus Shapirobacteria bacterium]|jgi:methylenetetrahydrofolate dehydrogenase (NADP+)/methenyltetrahydrofolate cyclohydrolase
MILLDGKATSLKILQDQKAKIANLPKPPRLDIILVGDDPSSLQYVSMKQKKADLVGILCQIHRLPADSTTAKVSALISSLNLDSAVTGILVQLPLPKNFNTQEILNTIDPSKDVDGLTATNLGLMFQKNPAAIASATPQAVLALLDNYQISLESKDVVIIGRSPHIGLPLVALMLQRNATVTVCHSYTPHLSAATGMADVVITAVGKQNFITGSMVKEGSIIIDIGLSQDPQTGKLVGDVDFDSVAPKCSYITPVPGGIGPMTIACLLNNVYNISHK